MRLHTRCPTKEEHEKGLRILACVTSSTRSGQVIPSTVSAPRNCINMVKMFERITTVCTRIFRQDVRPFEGHLSLIRGQIRPITGSSYFSGSLSSIVSIAFFLRPRSSSFDAFDCIAPGTSGSSCSHISSRVVITYPSRTCRSHWTHALRTSKFHLTLTFARSTVETIRRSLNQWVVITRPLWSLWALLSTHSPTLSTPLFKATSTTTLSVRA